MAASSISSPDLGKFYTLASWMPDSLSAAETPNANTSSMPTTRVTGKMWTALLALVEAIVERDYYQTGEIYRSAGSYSLENRKTFEAFRRFPVRYESGMLPVNRTVPDNIRMNAKNVDYDIAMQIIADGKFAREVLGGQSTRRGSAMYSSSMLDNGGWLPVFGWTDVKNVKAKFDAVSGGRTFWTLKDDDILSPDEEFSVDRYPACGRIYYDMIFYTDRDDDFPSPDFKDLSLDKTLSELLKENFGSKLDFSWVNEPTRRLSWKRIAAFNAMVACCNEMFEEWETRMEKKLIETKYIVTATGEARVPLHYTYDSPESEVPSGVEDVNSLSLNGVELTVKTEDPYDSEKESHETSYTGWASCSYTASKPNIASPSVDLNFSMSDEFGPPRSDLSSDSVRVPRWIYAQNPCPCTVSCSLVTQDGSIGLTYAYYVEVEGEELLLTSYSSYSSELRLISELPVKVSASTTYMVSKDRIVGIEQDGREARGMYGIRGGRVDWVQLGLIMRRKAAHVEGGNWKTDTNEWSTALNTLQNVQAIKDYYSSKMSNLKDSAEVLFLSNNYNNANPEDPAGYVGSLLRSKVIEYAGHRFGFNINMESEADGIGFSGLLYWNSENGMAERFEANGEWHGGVSIGITAEEKSGESTYDSSAVPKEISVEAKCASMVRTRWSFGALRMN